MNSNVSRREFLYRLGMASLFSTGAMAVGCKWTAKTTAQHPEIRLFATATLDIGTDGWSRLGADLGPHLLFKDNGNDAGPVISQMIGGSAGADYDLGGLLGGAEGVLAAAGAILPWDLSKIPNWNQAWTWAKSINHSHYQGKQFGLPLVVNADSMIYLPDRIKAIPGYESGVVDSYSAVFDPRLKGKTSMEDAWVNSAIFTAIYLKHNSLLKIDDPGNLTESELKGVMEFLIEKKRSGQFRKLWSGWEQGVEIMRSGEAIVMTGWEPIVKALNDQGIHAKYAVPKEGYEGWSIDLLLHAGAAKRNLVDWCHSTANWLYGGYYGARLAVMRGYAVPDDTCADYVRQNKPADGELILNTLNQVQHKISNTMSWQNVRPDNFQLYEEWWSKLRAA
jgi:putative spermidine/putrescine transport system substrate-binding protein